MGRVIAHALERVDLGEVPYAEAIAETGEWVRRRRAGLIPDRLALLSHPPVITYGSRTPRQELPVYGSVPLVEVDPAEDAVRSAVAEALGAG